MESPCAARDILVWKIQRGQRFTRFGRRAPSIFPDFSIKRPAGLDPEGEASKPRRNGRAASKSSGVTGFPQPAPMQAGIQFAHGGHQLPGAHLPNALAACGRGVTPAKRGLIPTPPSGLDHHAKTWLVPSPCRPHC